MAAMDRRGMLGLLGAGAWAARNSDAAESLNFSALDHIEISVPDAARSAAFYGRIFGGSIWKNKRGPKKYVKVGSWYVAIDQKPEGARVDHFSVGLHDYQIAALHSYLEQGGVAYRDFPSGRDLNVTDPDGVRVQLSSENSFAPLEGTTALQEPATEQPGGIFQAAGLDHILLNVSDPEKSAAFYGKIFGPVTQRNNNRTWFQTGQSRIGLLQIPAGQRAGVNHFCVAAAAFDYGAVTKRLEQAGVKVETAEIAGAPEFRDPDGFLVQVITPRASARP